MDWHVAAGDSTDVASVGRSLMEYLRRHAEPASDLGAAELAYSELTDEARRRGGDHLWLRLDWTKEAATLEVHDDAPPAGRVPAHDDALQDLVKFGDAPRVRRKNGEGFTASVTLPVRRRRERSLDPPRRTVNALPAPEEIGPDMAFGRESFLRALVVQLAQEVERAHGPDTAEEAVAQVGSDVGGRIEDEYRRAHSIVERLDPQEMADLYVQLKGAIDGDFYVIEAGEDRIVLGNRRCPFGDVVKRAPALCRMTSSVFGGIAARNSGASVVQLDARIAVGDPECRVTVLLGAAAGRAPYGHRYGQPHLEVADPLDVVLAEGHPYVREALAEALKDASITVKSQANSPQAVLWQVEKYRPDAVIIDFGVHATRDATGLASEVRRRHPDVAVLVLAEILEVDAVRALFAAGATRVGFLLKQHLTADGFVSALRRITSGATAIDPAIVPELLGRDDPDDPLAELTPREQDVLELLAAGLSNGAIAEELVISKRAVEKHVKSIFAKVLGDAPPERDRRVLAALAFRAAHERPALPPRATVSAKPLIAGRGRRATHRPRPSED